MVWCLLARRRAGASQRRAGTCCQVTAGVGAADRLVLPQIPAPEAGGASRRFCAVWADIAGAPSVCGSSAASCAVDAQSALSPAVLLGGRSPMPPPTGARDRSSLCPPLTTPTTTLQHRKRLRPVEPATQHTRVRSICWSLGGSAKLNATLRGLYNPQHPWHPYRGKGGGVAASASLENLQPPSLAVWHHLIITWRAPWS